MKKIIVFILFALITIRVQAQVGIGNTNPKAVLDISATSQTAPNNKDGILIPKIDEFPTVNPTFDQDGMLVFVSGLGGVTKGFYYWNNTTTAWVELSNSVDNDNQDLSLTGNTLSLTNDGTTVDLSSFLDADNLGNHNATTDLDLNSNAITEVERLSTLGTSDYDKLRVFSSANYTIGMHSAMTYGFLNDWATTFTMNNDADRGWIWRDADDVQSDGAMSLTTDGRMTLKNYLNLPNITDASGTVNTGVLEIGGNLRFDGDEIITNTNTDLFLQHDNNGDFRVDNTTLMVDASENRVGIGTITPDTTLDVNGTLAVRGGTPGIGKVLTSNATGEASWLDPVVNNDADWFEEASTNVPGAISSNIYTNGNVGIGTNTPEYSLDIASNASTVSGGSRIVLSGTMTSGSVYGNYFESTVNGNGLHYGSYNLIGGSGTGDFIGAINQLSATGFGIKTGVRNIISNSEDGIIFGSISGVQNQLTGTGNEDNYGIDNSINVNGSGYHYGTNNNIRGNGSGNHYGTRNSLSGSGDGNQVGTENYVINSSNGTHYGVYNLLSGVGTGWHYGSRNDLSGTGAGVQIGVRNSITNSSNGTHYGVNNSLSGTGAGWHYGVRNYLSGSGSGNQIGIENLVANSSNGTHYGVYNRLIGTGTGIKYGVYSSVPSSSGNYAGYFVGNVYATGTFTTSARHLKTNIIDAPSALDDIMLLKVKNYNFKTKQYNFMNLQEGKQTGFIAEELENVFPELVAKAIQPELTKKQVESGESPHDEVEFKAVNYSGLVPYLVKGIQEQQKVIESQNKKIKSLETRLARIEALLDK